MAKAYSYIRFSRPEQMRGDSLRRQKEAAEKWAAENGHVIDESLTDLGVSAYRGLNRIKGALGGFLALVEKGEVPRGSLLIIESLDRFSRQGVLEVLPRFIDLLQAGIIVVTLIDRQVYSAERIEAEPMALFGSLMVIMRAHEESRTKATRLSESWANKRKVASDKVITARVPGWLEVRTVDGKRRIEFKPGAREIIRRIFSETVGGHGKRQVGQKLKAANYPTFNRGKDWHPSYIQKVLENRAVFGEMQCYRLDEESRRVTAGAPIANYYPAAVTEGDFIRANTAKASRKISGGKPLAEGAVNLLRGLAYCSCGSRMMRENKGPPPKGGAHLVCADARRGRCTHGRRWKVDWAEDLVLERSSRINVRRLLAPAVESGPVPLTAADLENRVADLSGRLTRIMDSVERGIGEYQDRALELSREVKSAKAELAEFRKNSSRRAHEPSLEQRRALMADLKARLASATDEERVELRVRLAQEVRGAFKKISFGPDRIEATYKGMVPYGEVMVARDVTVLIHTENPDELLEMASMQLDPDAMRRQDAGVAEFLRRSRLRRMSIAEVEAANLGSDGLEILDDDEDVLRPR